MILSKLVEYIKAKPGPHKTAQLAKAVGANKNTCRRIMGELRQLGLAEIVGRQGAESLWQYVAPAPQKVIFLQSAGEGETSIDSLARQDAIAARFIKARQTGYTQKKEGEQCTRLKRKSVRTRLRKTTAI